MPNIELYVGGTILFGYGCRVRGCNRIGMIICLANGKFFWLLAKADILLLLLLPPHSAAENLTLNSPRINIAG